MIRDLFFLYMFFIIIIILLLVDHPPSSQPGQSRWGRVTFLSQMEAQTAIDGLNGAPPFKLAVMFARTEEEKEAQRREEERINNMVATRNRDWDEYHRTQGVGHKLPIGSRGHNLAVIIFFIVLRLANFLPNFSKNN